MPRRAAKDVPGTERYRDERRDDAGPRMHSREWHDHDEPHELEPVGENEGKDAVMEAESSGDRAGMGRRRMKAAGSQGRERRKRTVPPSKGVSKRPAGKRSKRGKASMSGTRRKAGPRGNRRI